MKKISKAAAFFLTVCILLSASVTAYASSDSAGMEAEANQSAGIGADPAELITAVQQKDTEKLVDLLMNWLGDYYRQNGLKDDFGYFNADAYLAAYQDVNTAYKGDRRQALEHYITVGAKEGRISGGKYDLPLAVRIDPSFLLSPDILGAMGDPAAFLKAAEKHVELITKGGMSTGGSSGGGDTPEGPGSHTLICYGSGLNLNLEECLLRGIVTLYGTENINMVLAMGGSYKWENDYIMNLLGDSVGSANKNKTGFFAVNVSELNCALESVSEEFGIPVSSIIDKMEEYTEEGKQLKAAVNSAIYSENVLPLVEGTEVSSDAGLGSPETLRTVLELAKTKYQAETYALSFSGHGGGATGCLESEDWSPMLDSIMIDEALDSAGFGEQNRMTMIAFDSCSMGCIETAAVLGKYCEYMYGSEAEQTNDINMHVWLSAVKDNLNSNDFSKEVAYAIYQQRASLTFPALSTAAISDSSHAQELLDAIDQWAEAMLAKMNNEDPDTAEKYFYALKKASAYCYKVSPSAKAFDIKDLMQEIKLFLNEQDISALDAEIDAVIAAADDFSDQNSVSIDDRFLYDSMKGGVIESNAIYRDEHLKYDLCGFSITFPDSLLTCLIQAKNYGMKDHIDEIRNKFNNEYISKFEKLGLNRYTELINKYLDHYFTVAEADRISKLSKEMISCSSEEGAVAGYKDIASVSWNEDKTFVQVDVKDYCPVSTRSAYSSGDSFIDLIETSNGFRTYLTSKLENTPTDQNAQNDRSKNYDMVFTNANYSYQAAKGYKNCIELQLKCFLEDSGMTVSYVEKDGVQWEDADYLDLLVDVQQSGMAVNKEDVLKAVVSELGDLIAVREKAQKAYDENPTDENKKTLDEAVAECNKVCNEFTLYYGECATADNVKTENAYLAFRNGSGGNKVYFDAAKKSDSGDTYEQINDEKTIRFYHYEFSNVISEDKDTGTDNLIPIETGSNYNGSYYENAKYDYDVTDTDKQVMVKTKGLSSFLFLLEGKLAADHLGYYVSLINGDDETVILNADKDGQNTALTGENYTTPLTRGQLKAALRAESAEQTEEPAAPEESTEPEELKEEPASEYKDDSISDDQEKEKEQIITPEQSEQVNEPEQQEISENTAAKEQEQPEQAETVEEKQPQTEAQNEAA